MRLHPAPALLAAEVADDIREGRVDRWMFADLGPPAEWQCPVVYFEVFTGLTDLLASWTAVLPVGDIAHHVLLPSPGDRILVLDALVPEESGHVGIVDHVGDEWVAVTFVTDEPTIESGAFRGCTVTRTQVTRWAVLPA